MISSLKEMTFWELLKNNESLEDHNIPDELKEEYNSIIEMPIYDLLEKAKLSKEFALSVLHNQKLLAKLGRYDVDAIDHFNKSFFKTSGNGNILYYMEISGHHLEKFLKLHKSVWEEAKRIGVDKFLSECQCRAIERYHTDDKQLDGTYNNLYFGN